MLIDTHCHIDFFDNPISTAQAYERTRTRCIMATMLPSHFRAAITHLSRFRSVRRALGIHPLRADEGSREVTMFRNLVNEVEYIGEIGLDLSKEGIATKKQQFDIVMCVLRYLNPGKFVTVHSRNAHEELARLLEDNQVGPVCFHYFIGGTRAAREIAEKGHYFSINHRMLRSKHREILDAVPREKILVESDGPFLTKRPLAVIEYVYDKLSEIWKIDRDQVEKLVVSNFDKCRTAAAWL